jgi:nucleoside-diphosphate kinase
MKTLQRTLTIIKPDAVRKHAVGDIIEQFEKNGFHILAMKMLEISKHQAEQFYAVHAGKSFFNSLTDFMSSGPVVVVALEKEDAIAELRKLMGATNPANAEEGTIRKKWATSIEHNAIHGSDADDTARFELSYFFAGYELAQ